MAYIAAPQTLNYENYSAADSELESAVQVCEEQTGHQVDGLAKDADLDSYISDLASLSWDIDKFLRLYDRANEEDLNDMKAHLEKVTNTIKNITIIYTNCVSEAMNNYEAHLKAQGYKLALQCIEHSA